MENWVIKKYFVIWIIHKTLTSYKYIINNKRNSPQKTGLYGSVGHRRNKTEHNILVVRSGYSS
jgi:hypothetical protein